MNLIIDIGNTSIKLARFQAPDSVLLDVTAIDNKNDNELQSFLSQCLDIQCAIVSSVTLVPTILIDFLQKQIPHYVSFNSTTPLPIINLYATPQTLGSDRLAPMVSARKQFPNQNVLVIDSGTCIKFNLLTAKGEFLGGAISPGLLMRFQALNHYTSKLPLVQPDSNYSAFIGNDTKTSILSGVQEGLIGEINHQITLYEREFSDLMLILTGGDAAFFENRLKKQIFVDPHIVLRGLNEILEFVNEPK